MSARRPCPEAPGPLEDFAVQFDPLFGSYAQRVNFRNYVSGLLLPRDRAKTLTALAGAEPVVQAQAAPVQRTAILFVRIELGCRGDQPPSPAIVNGRPGDSRD